MSDNLFTPGPDGTWGVAGSHLADVVSIDGHDLSTTKSNGQQSNGAQLLDDVHAFLTTYVRLASPEQADAVTLWIAHTYALEAMGHTPRLIVSAPQKACGKTRLLEVIEQLAHDAHIFSAKGGVTTAAVRNLASDGHTLLLDEADNAYKHRGEGTAELTSIINDGIRKGASSSKMVADGDGNHTRSANSIYCPIAIAGRQLLQLLDDALLSRGVVIQMRPKPRPAKFRTRQLENDIATLKRRLFHYVGGGQPSKRASQKEWKELTALASRDAIPDLPHVSDRTEEGWEGLIAIADLAGGDWPQRARGALKVLDAELTAALSDQESDVNALLFSDLRRLWPVGAPGWRSTDVLASLNDLEYRPWPQWNSSRNAASPGLNARNLSKLLSAYNIKPQRDRLGSYYDRSDFEQAWQDYPTT